MLFGSFADWLRPLHPSAWRFETGRILEIPVTTCPVLQTPLHPSYLIYLARYSPLVAPLYARAAIECAVPSGSGLPFLHPLDFIGAGEVERLAFFPGMGMPLESKISVLRQTVAELKRHHDVVTMDEHALVILGRMRVRELPPAALAGRAESLP